MVAAFRESLLTNARSIGRALSEAEAAALQAHFELLSRWGRRMNLTGLKDEDAIVRRHFLEPIAAAAFIGGEEGRLVDLGSGNGFPAVPLKVLHPALELVLVESSEKKSAFLWTVIRELGLKSARVETRHIRRLADLADLLPCRYLSARAVRLEEFLGGGEITILQPGGKALLFVTPAQARSLEARPLPGLRLSGTHPLPSGSRSVLAVLEPREP